MMAPTTCITSSTGSNRASWIVVIVVSGLVSRTACMNSVACVGNNNCNLELDCKKERIRLIDQQYGYSTSGKQCRPIRTDNGKDCYKESPPMCCVVKDLCTSPFPKEQLYHLYQECSGLESCSIAARSGKLQCGPMGTTVSTDSNIVKYQCIKGRDTVQFCEGKQVEKEVVNIYFSDNVVMQYENQMCTCTIQANTAYSITIEDIRPLRPGNTTICSSAIIDNFDKKCNDSKEVWENFVYRETWDTKQDVITVKHLFAQGKDDTPTMIWIRVESDTKREKVNIVCEGPVQGKTTPTIGSPSTTKPSSGSATSTTPKPGSGSATSTTPKPSSGSATSTTPKPSSGSVTSTTTKPSSGSATSTTTKPSSGSATSTTPKPSSGSATYTTPKPSSGSATSTTTETSSGSATSTTAPFISTNTDTSVGGTVSSSSASPNHARVTADEDKVPVAAIVVPLLLVLLGSTASVMSVWFWRKRRKAATEKHTNISNVTYMSSDVTSSRISGTDRTYDLPEEGEYSTIDGNGLAKSSCESDNDGYAIPPDAVRADDTTEYDVANLRRKHVLLDPSYARLQVTSTNNFFLTQADDYSHIPAANGADEYSHLQVTKPPNRSLEKLPDDEEDTYDHTSAGGAIHHPEQIPVSMVIGLSPLFSHTAASSSGKQEVPVDDDGGEEHAYFTLEKVDQQ